MKIYTKTGDEGETGLLGGARVNKSHLAIEVCGCLDETNSLIGLVVSQPSLSGIDQTFSTSNRLRLLQIQNDLFDLGSRVAACLSETSRPADFSSGRTEQLEGWIDRIQGKLPELKEFILPGGSQRGAMLHLARSVCRRTERMLVALIASGTSRDLSGELIYLNRLGDLLFVLARLVNQQDGVSETKWAVTRQPDSH